ncbi:MAG: hypothetical protein G01um10143_814 [Parcubacteria group bacterium Gr01-1014_3]|nr:MAG: hypothetical protein G01um10143_814 [Parcubacteria group bacterium Gr01-1014_3]
MGQTLKLKYFLAGLLLVIAIGFYFFNTHYSIANPAPFYTDLILHFLGGFWIAGLSSYLLLTNNFRLSRSAVLNGLIIVGFSIFIGVAWEWYEYVVASIVGIKQDPLDDVFGDLLLDMLGGTAFALFYKLKALISDSK